MTTSTVTRSEISEALANALSLPKQKTSEIVDTVIHEMIDALAKEKELKLSTFGTFMARQKSARVGRNPKTGVEVTIKPRLSISFKASSVFKAKIEKSA